MSLRKRLFARFYDNAQSEYEQYNAERKQALLGEARGTVLEIGPGTGVNFAYLPKDIQWIGVEPNPYMRARLSERAREQDFEPHFTGLAGNRIEVDDASIDVVVSTLVLCSVPDPRETLREVQRVLRPGGRFLFVEHVGAPHGTWLRRGQRIARPFWKFMADGCHPDRDIGHAIEEAGFASLELVSFRVQHNIFASVVAPHIAGKAVV